MSAVLLRMLEKGHVITVDDENMIEECKKNGEDYNKVIQDLQFKRIIYIDNKRIGTLSDNWMTVIYNGKHYYGVNFNNRMMQWYNGLLKKKLSE